MSAGWCGHQIGMGAHEAPDEPVEGTAERSSEPLPDVFEHILLWTGRAGEGDRQCGHLLRVHAPADLQAIPRATLEVLRRDRVGIEVPGRDEMKRAPHESRADHVVPLDRRPELLASEARQARPECDVWRGR